MAPATIPWRWPKPSVKRVVDGPGPVAGGNRDPGGAGRGSRPTQPPAPKVDISQPLPLGDASVDLCLMATVLHDLVESGKRRGALKEAQRVLKPGGALAIVEFDKVAGPPGPPLRIRLNPEEVATLAAPYGFRKSRMARVGPYNYLLLFTNGEV